MPPGARFEWRASWDLDVMGVARPTRVALPEIERCGGGSFVIVSSISAYSPGPNTYDYRIDGGYVTTI